MKVPDCMYQKAFWVVVPILIVTSFGILGGINEQVQANSDELNLRNHNVNVIIPKLEITVDKNHDNILIICTTLKAPCK